MLATSGAMRAFFFRGSFRVGGPLPATAAAAAVTTMQRRYQGSLGDAQQATPVSSTGEPPAAPASASASSHAPAPTPSLQQLYKSSHRGSGERPMPKPMKPKALKPRTIPAISDADAAILGARSSCAEDLGPVQERALSPLQKRQLLFKSKAAFVLTPQALRRVKYLLSQYKSKHTPGATAGAAAAAPSGIRIGVRRRGCSGYSYTVNYYMSPEPGAAVNGAAPSTAPAAANSVKRRGKEKAGSMGDVVVEQDGVKVVVDGDALFYVIGTEMDYVVRDVEEKFTFKNPNQKYSCGCEESFMPFDEDDLDD